MSHTFQILKLKVLFNSSFRNRLYPLSKDIRIIIIQYAQQQSELSKRSKQFLSIGVTAFVFYPHISDIGGRKLGAWSN